jgi:hypothetical protein
MTEELDIQCPSCGTIYSNLEQLCPYCGQPQPLPEADHEESEEYEEREEYVEREEEYEKYEGEAGYEGYEADEGYDNDQDYAEPEVYEGYGQYDSYTGYAEEDTFAEYESPEGYVGYPFEEDESADEIAAAPRRFTKRRVLLGCLGTLLCIGLFYGAIGLMAAYHGLQEQAAGKRTEAEQHYQRGQEHLTNNSLELAVAEFELAVSLNPGLLEAREALREAKRLVQALPTPTSETRSEAAASILEKAESQIAEENWAEAAQTLSQLRDLDPDHQPEHVSELLYTANYQLGLQLTRPDQIEEALLAFERALVERPDDAEVIVQRAKASLYVEGKTAEASDRRKAVEAFSQLYQEDSNYLDIKERLLKNYELLGDELAEQEAWCSAEAQYLEANRLEPSPELQDKAEDSSQHCQELTVAQAEGSASAQLTPQATASSSMGGAAAVTRTTTAVTPTSAEDSGSGSIYFSAFNQHDLRWEILAVPAGGGTPKVVALNGTMPAVSPNGRWLVYHSQLLDAEGFHRLDLTNGEDARISLYQRHILPRWGGDNERFIFVAQEPGTGRWQVQLGFADGKGDPVILRDGRTPDWSPKGDLIAYQGTDPVGNNPGLYLVPFGGGEETRLTNHESDRAPDFSPDGAQIAYMSTKGGSWDIYTVSAAGSAPHQITTSPAQDGLPAWSPDGTQIAYVSDAGGSWAIYVVNAAGGTPVKVTTWDGTNLPDWLLAQIWWAR